MAAIGASLAAGCMVRLIGRGCTHIRVLFREAAGKGYIATGWRNVLQSPTVAQLAHNVLHVCVATQASLTNCTDCELVRPGMEHVDHKSDSCLDRCRRA